MSPFSGRQWRFIAALIVLSAAAVSRAQLTVPAYNSYPSASAKLYLEFRGIDGPYNEPYDTDHNLTSFSPSELCDIHEMWQRVAEKFSPFNINVTTVDPVSWNKREALRVVVGGDGAWLGQPASGSAELNSFETEEMATSYVYPLNFNPPTPARIAETIAHEAGHGFGLEHQALFSGATLVTEYNPGTADKAPIMGESRNSTRGLWWSGPRTSGINQDDLAVLSATTNFWEPGFGYRLDDHPSTRQTAEPLNIIDHDFSTNGVIEKTTDQDWYSFTTNDGPVNISADVAEKGPMLDLTMKLYDSLGGLVVTKASPSLGEAINMTLPAGLYYVDIESALGYGDVGQYTLHGNTSLVPEPASIVTLLALPLLLRRPNRKTRTF